MDCRLAKHNRTNVGGAKEDPPKKKESKKQPKKEKEKAATIDSVMDLELVCTHF